MLHICQTLDLKVPCHERISHTFRFLVGIFVFSAASLYSLDLLWEWRATLKEGLSPTASIQATLSRLERFHVHPDGISCMHLAL